MSDPIIDAARFVLANLEWLRHRPEIDEQLADIAAAARVVAGIVRGPAEQQYLGPCGAERQHGGLCAPGPGPCFADDFTDDCTCWCHEGGSDICDGDIYAPREAQNGRCRVCKAEVASEDRRAWLDAQARSHAFRAAHIAQAYGINAKTIRGWATDRPEIRDRDGKLIRSATPARLRIHGHDLDGYDLFLVDDVLSLAAAEAARRAEQQAKRARRKENAA